MKLNYNLILVLVIASQGVKGEFFSDQDLVRVIQSINQPKSHFSESQSADIEVEPGMVRSKVGPIEGAKFMFDTVGLAYCSPRQILDYKGNYSKRLSRRYQPLHVITNTQYDMQVYVASFSVRKEMMVVFRGIASDDNLNMLLKTSQVPFDKQKYVLVHSGAKTILDTMEADLLKYLVPLFNQKQYRDYTIVFAGHSLGGVVATLATAKLSPKLNLPWERVHLFTYGSPRVGNKQFANWFNSKPLDSTRVVNNNDPLPGFPKSKYAHIHNEVFINGQETITCGTSSYEDPDCSQSHSLISSHNDHYSAWGKTLTFKDC